MSAVSNNLTNRIKQTTNKISGSSLASNRATKQTLGRKQSTSARTANNSSISKNTKLPITDFDDPEAGLTDPFENPILLAFIMLITFGFIAYGLYYYYRRDTDYKQAQTFYGSDVLAYEPLFNMNADKVEACVSRCQKDSMCQGVTFNSDTLTCTGSEEGRLRDDSVNFTSWVKPERITEKLHKKANTDKPIVGLANGLMTLKNTEFARPPFISRFNFSLFLYINDFYEGHGKWRNILCKGTPWPAGEPLDTPYWESVSAERPDQCLGIWLAPFNNNLRICVTTRRQNSPSATASNATAGNATAGNTIIQQTLEYIDIQNIPTRKLFHLSVNMVEGGMEIYMNGKLHRMQTLKGAPMWNDLPLTIFGQTSTPATIMDLVFIPDSADLDDIRAQTRKLQEYSEKLRE
jgi:hypothetical protein